MIQDIGKTSIAEPFVKVNAKDKWRSFDEARSFTHSQCIDSVKEFRVWASSTKRPSDIPAYPDKVYADVWDGWADWLGFAPRAFVDARAFARTLNLDTRDKWIAYVATGGLPRDIPKWPQNVYKDIGWNSWEDWLGRQAGFRFRPFEQARAFARSLKITSRRDWTAFVQSDKCPKDIPSSPAEAYPDQWSGYGDWLGKHTRWNQNAILAFLNSLRPLIQDLCPAEIFAILQWNGLIGKRFPTNRNAALLRSLETLCTTSSPEKAIEQFGSQLAQIAEEPDGTEDCANEDSSCELAPVTPDILSISTPLHCIRALSSLNVLDGLLSSFVIDNEEILEFLVDNRVAAIWQRVLDGNPAEIVYALRAEVGGEYFNRIRNRFIEQYEGAMSLAIPVDYDFQRNGVLQPPNLMQRLSAYLLLKKKRLGNWSGVGAGKTLSAVLSSRLIGARLSVIIAVNATIDRWVETIRESFPFSHVHAKDVCNFVIDPNRPNYLVLNFESFQQVWSDEFIRSITTDNRIDLVVLDEIQSVRQRTPAVESKRRQLVRSLLEEADARNPELRVLGMSATPVVNNLHEARSLLELVTGEDLAALPTRPTVENAILVHRKLIQHGIRYRPLYSQSLVTSHPEIDGNALLQEIRQVNGRDLRSLEEVLLKRKLPWIMAQLQPGTILYTQFVTGIVEPLKQACKEKGFRVGVFTGDEKSGLKAFRDGQVDILIGSAPIGTGVDGLQGVSNRLIFVSLPWTSAEYEQVIGRLHRQGSRFDQVEVTIPQIILRHADGREWSWDKSRLERIQWKRTLADSAVDGVIPQGHLPSKEEMQVESLAALNKWIAQVGSETPVSESRENDQDLIETPATINPAVL